MRKITHSELRRIAQSAREAGWTVEFTRNGHLRFLAPDGDGIVVTGSTPSDTRSVKNCVARLRQHGLAI